MLSDVTSPYSTTKLTGPYASAAVAFAPSVNARGHDRKVERDLVEHRGIGMHVLFISPRQREEYALSSWFLIMKQLANLTNVKKLSSLTEYLRM